MQTKSNTAQGALSRSNNCTSMPSKTPLGCVAGPERAGPRVTANNAVANSSTCLDETQTLPSDLGPGKQATRMVVLDVPTTDGSIDSAEISTGRVWEWATPKAGVVARAGAA